MKIHEYPDREMLAIDVANRLAGDLENGLLRHERVSFAVPGGTTPGPIFDVLCASKLDWDRVHLLLTDERWVPEDDPRSNAALVRERLLTSRASETRFRSYYREDLGLEEAAEQMSADLQDDLPLSLLLLGMGADMHTASLFPGAAGTEQALREDAPALVPIRPEGQEPRISLSAPVLAGALTKHLVIYGTEKRAALKKAQGLGADRAPIRAVMEDLIVHWAE